jgi:predicted RNA-binding Zn-ribbon protein involved in translation (DUF1610 family)
MKHLQTQHTTMTVDDYPPICPRCNRHIAAIFTGVLTNLGEGEEEAVFRCPHCGLYFVGQFRMNYNRSIYLYQGVLPWTPSNRAFPLIDLVSERFIEIFNQAVAAEEYGLTDISGTGYRKALEFLIKDYCIALSPNNAESIRKKFLKSVIDEHLGDGKLKIAATLTTWLGNDEGHYERRWIDKDLSDLKALLKLTIAFVNEEVQLEQYVQSMKPDSDKKLTLLQSPSPEK